MWSLITNEKDSQSYGDSQDRSSLLYHMCWFWTFESHPTRSACTTQDAGDKAVPRTPGARVEFKSPEGVTRPADSTKLAQELGVEVGHLSAAGACQQMPWRSPCLPAPL